MNFVQGAKAKLTAMALAFAGAGLLAGVKVSSTYEFEARDKDGNLKWRETVSNLVVNVGLDDVLNKYFKGSAYTAAFYVGLKNSGTVAAADTMASHAGWTENVTYSEATREVLTLGTVSGQSVNNSASRAEFSINGTTTINGAFVTTNDTKSGTTGTLYGAADFAVSRSLASGDTLFVTITLTAASALAMGLEAVSFLDDLVITNPGSGDDQAEGDDHLRNIKTALKATFPGLAGRAWRVQVKSSGYTIAATDNMSIIRCTAALTLAVTAVATLGNGFVALIEAAGGDVVVDPAASEQINGAATVTIPNGYNGLLRSDGSAFTVLGLLPLASSSARTLLDVYSKSEVYTQAEVDAEITAAIDAVVPPGTQLDYMGGSVQTGFLACDGSNVSRTTYAILFGKIGTTWGSGDGSTTFTLPDSRRRVTVGSGGTGTGTLGNAVGNTGGAETHTLTTAELAVHAHSAPVRQSFTVGAGGSSEQYCVAGSTGNAGSGSAHNNMQPSMVVTKMIRTGL